MKKSIISILLCVSMLFCLSSCGGETKISTEIGEGIFSSFVTTDMNGIVVTQKVFEEHKVTMIILWGTFCSPCISEMPDLAELNKEYADQGFQVIGIPVDIVDQNLIKIDDKVKDANDVVEFLAQFGWEVTAEPVEVKTVTIPSEFDKVFSAYNEIQKAQGLNLSKFQGKDVTRYTLCITNYPDYEGTVYANVLIYRNRVIGGDVCSADAPGFVHGFFKSKL